MAKEIFNVSQFKVKNKKKLSLGTICVVDQLILAAFAIVWLKCCCFGDDLGLVSGLLAGFFS